jgi:hypothetical protein
MTISKRVYESSQRNAEAVTKLSKSLQELQKSVARLTKEIEESTESEEEGETPALIPARDGHRPSKRCGDYWGAGWASHPPPRALYRATKFVDTVPVLWTKESSVAYSDRWASRTLRKSVWPST